MVIITQLAGNRARSRVQTRLLVQTVPERTMQMLATVKINSARFMVLLRVMLSWVYCTAQSSSALAMIFFFFFLQVDEVIYLLSYRNTVGVQYVLIH